MLIVIGLLATIAVLLAVDVASIRRQTEYARRQECFSAAIQYQNDGPQPTDLTARIERACRIPNPLTPTLASFARTWQRHSTRVEIVGKEVRVIYRVYRTCGPGVGQPCDSLIGNGIISGGRATITLTGVDGHGVAHGLILTSTDTSTLPIGTVTLTLTPGDHLFIEVQGRQPFGELCGPSAPSDSCGAYPR